MELFRQWLLGVAACAMLVGLLRRLCPAGAAREAARFAGALLLLCAMLRPFASFETPDLTRGAARWSEERARLEAELRHEAESALADGIAREWEAYIEDKAARLGVDVRAEVTMAMRGGVPVPERVTLRGTYSAALADAVAAELGIAKEKQEWIDSG